jgi:hypothetical protein
MTLSLDTVGNSLDVAVLAENGECCADVFQFSIKFI